MAIDLIQTSGAAADPHAAIASAASGSPGPRRPDPEAAPSKTVANGRQGGEPEAAAQADSIYLRAEIEHAQSVELANDTTFSYERDDKDGQIYVHVKDKSTGEELYRVPRNMHSGMEVQTTPRPKVDVRI